MFSAKQTNIKDGSFQACSRPLKTHWEEWEASLLIDAALSNKLVDIYIPDTGQRTQSLIHGFDLHSSELLLDGLYPFPNAIKQGISEERPIEFWIQVKAGSAFLNILVLVKELEASFITVQVLEAGLTRNRRWEDRIYFPKPSSPKVELALPDKVLQNSHLSNISVGGAQILSFGKSQTKGHRAVRCRVVFDRDYVIDLKAELLQNQFVRSPCCHSILRLKFCHESQEQRSHLASLIFAFQPTSGKSAA